MGYRNYFCKISKKELEEIRKCRTVAELAEWGKTAGREVVNNPPPKGSGLEKSPVD